MNTLNVKKRNGSKEPYDIDKINKCLSWSLEDLENVSAADIIQKVNLNLYDGITTNSIHSLLVQAAKDLLSEDKPNYQYVASKLLSMQLRKQVWGYKKTSEDPPTLKEQINFGVTRNIYDSQLLEFSDAELLELDAHINHDRDFQLTFASLQQLIDKYLVQNRVTREIYETPQFAYMLAAMTVFIKYPDRVKWIKETYDSFSLHKINLPTPQMSGLRTPTRQYASCMLIKMGDTLDSIKATMNAVMSATASKYGIGVEVSDIRNIGSPIRNGEVSHTGVFPYLKVLEATVRSCIQGGIRGGSATVNVNFFHPEIENIISLKSPAGSEDSKARRLDFTIKLSKLFYSRFMNDGLISLFNPQDCRELYEAFGTPEFDEMYVALEKDKTKIKKQIPAKELMSMLVKERTETGRIYILNIDHANSHGTFIDTVQSSNLCVTGETRLNTSKGLVKAIDLYNLGTPLKTAFDTRIETNKKGVEYTESTPMYCTGNRQPIWKVTTNGGYSIRGTADHGLYINKTNSKGILKNNLKRVCIKDLVIGDRLAIQSDLGMFGKINDPELAFLTGIIAGDGTFSSNSAVISLHNTELNLYDFIIENRKKLYKKYNMKSTHNYKESGHKLIKVSNTHSTYKISSKNVYNLLKEKIGNPKDIKQFVPEFVFQGDKETVVNYLQGLYTADGTCYCKNSPMIQLTSINQSLLKDVQLLLSNFGIMCNIQKSTSSSINFTHVTKSGEHREYISKQAYRLDITGKNVKLFSEHIGFKGDKQKKLEELVSNRSLYNKETYTYIKSIEFDGYEDVFDVTSPKNNTIIFNGIVSSNCTEVIHPLKPLQYEKDPEGLIGVCVLSAINMLAIKNDKDLEKQCTLIVRILDEVIDTQDYFCPAAERFATNYRSLAVGITNLAAWMAKHNLSYTETTSLEPLNQWMEKFYYYLVKGSIQLAKEKGACNYYEKTKYSQGILAIDTYKKTVDELVSGDLQLDWDSLRKDLKEYGIRHASLTSIAPTESSSVVSNATNGIEPIRSFVTFKSSKQGSVPMLAPKYEQLKNKYELAFNLKNNVQIINISAVLQKYTDMGISTNLYYNYNNYLNNKIPDEDIITDLMYSYRMGLKSLYYSNTLSFNVDNIIEESDCAGGACKI